MTSINTNINPSINPDFDSSEVGISPVTQPASPPPTGSEIWEDTKDTTSTAVAQSGIVTLSDDPMTPILSPPGVLNTASVEGSVKTTSVGGEAEITLNNAITNLNNLDRSVTNVSGFLPANNSNQLMLKEFLQGIRSAIDQLKKALADVKAQDAQSKANANKAKGDIQEEKLTSSELFLKYQGVRDKTSRIGVAKGFEMAIDIVLIALMVTMVIAIPFQLPLLLIATPLIPVFVTMAVSLATLGIMASTDIAEGSTKGWMWKGTVGKLGDERQSLNEQINKSWDAAAPTISKYNKELGSTEDVLLAMISALMKLLAKLMMGSQLGQTDMAELQKALAGVKNPDIPTELQGQMSKLAETIESYNNSLPKAIAGNEKQPGYIKDAMQALMLYTFHRENGDTTAAANALDALEKSLVNFTTTIIQDPSTSIMTNAFKNVAKGTDTRAAAESNIAYHAA